MNRKQRRKKQNQEKLKVIRSRLIPPSNLLATPPRPSERRIPLFRIPDEDSLEGAHLKKMMERDIEFQLRLKKFGELIPKFLVARSEDGSNLPLSNQLRYYIEEFANRIFTAGFDSMPTSFVVMQSFTKVDREFLLFDLLPEIEHLLSLREYLRWYEATPPLSLSALSDVLKEDWIYSFEFLGDPLEIELQTGITSIVTGIALVRQAHEVSCMLLGGQKPLFISREAAGHVVKDSEIFPGRESLFEKENKYNYEDAFLPGSPEFGKALMFTRFDLNSQTFGSRFVHLDFGKGFHVITDDQSVFDDIPLEAQLSHLERSKHDLKLYDKLYSTLSSCLFLPIFCLEKQAGVQKIEVTTKLGVDYKKLRAIRRLLGTRSMQGVRTLHLYPNIGESTVKASISVRPPKLQSRRDGYWKIIDPLQLGVGPDGNRVVGRTWVTRQETWLAGSPEAVVINAMRKRIGPDVGQIYLQRSPGLAVGLYKIGLTRRTSDERATELSASTSAPLPFEVLAEWEVSNCSQVEHEIHNRLDAFRVNPKREFFAADLRIIFSTIQTVVQEDEKNYPN